MKEEYDFAKGERGKFFRENSTLNLPIYLDSANSSASRWAGNCSRY